jgi:hypothetical protein
MSLPFERIYESTDIVCIADAIEIIPAPEPTPAAATTELTNRLRVVQVWKGDPPDTLVLRGLTGRKYDPQGRTVVWGQACPEPKRFVAGKRYLVFASSRPPGELPTAGSRTREISAAGAEMIWLQRRVGPGRCVAPDAEPILMFSYRSLVQQLEHGDSLAQLGAVRAFGIDLPDSSGFVVPALVRAMHRMDPPLLRRYACSVIVRWGRADRHARKVFYEALEGDEPEIRLLAAETQIQGPSGKMQRRVLKRREDPVPEVRAAALLRCADLLEGKHPPVREYREALEDTAAIVRIEAIYALEKLIDDPTIKAALEERMTDRDSTVAAVAKKVVGRMGTKRR